MMSPNAIKGAGSGVSYLNYMTKKDDYYLDGESRGRFKFVGSGAKALGIDCFEDIEEARQIFEGLMKGVTPDGLTTKHLSRLDPEALEKNQKKRTSAYDLTFSAEKTVSIAWAGSQGETRERIKSAHDKAVLAALDFMEKEFRLVNQGKGYSKQTQADLIAAKFDHIASRAKDPQLHSHLVVFNLAIRRSDGELMTLNARDFFYMKKFLGAFYQNEMARILRQEGMAISKKGEFFEMSGVDSDLRRNFSKRRQAIEAELASIGMEGGYASAVVAKMTRDKKEKIDAESLMQEWQEKCEEMGFDEAKLFGKSDIQFDRDGFLSSLTEMESAVTKSEVMKSLMLETIGLYSYDELEIEIDKMVSSGDLVLMKLDPEKDTINYVNDALNLPANKKRKEKESNFFTTKEMIKTEENFLNFSEKLLSTNNFEVSKEKLDAALDDFVEKNGFKPSSEQIEAVSHIMSGSSMKAINGDAGTGKSTSLTLGRMAFELSGLNVVGCAHTGQAAKELEKSSGIESMTIDSLLLASDHYDRIDADVIVIDEAGMVGSRHMNRLVERAYWSGCRIVMLGDVKQFNPVVAGSPFRAFCEKNDKATLTVAFRQKNEYTKAMAEHAKNSDSKKFISTAAAADKIKFGDGFDEAKEMAASAFLDKVDIKDIESAIVISANNAAVEAINNSVRDKLKASEVIGEDDVTLKNGLTVSKGDWVVTLKNSKEFDVMNGNRFVVDSAHENGILTLKTSDGKIKVLDTNRYDGNLALAYAVTGHKSQGATVGNTIAFFSEDMYSLEANASYVWATRSKDDLQIVSDISLRDVDEKLDLGDVVDINNLTLEEEKAYKLALIESRLNSYTTKKMTTDLVRVDAHEMLPKSEKGYELIKGQALLQDSETDAKKNSEQRLSPAQKSFLKSASSYLDLVSNSSNRLQITENASLELPTEDEIKRGLGSEIRSTIELKNNLVKFEKNQVAKKEDDEFSKKLKAAVEAEEKIKRVENLSKENVVTRTLR